MMMMSVLCYLDRAGEVCVGDVEGEGAQTVRQGQGDQQARAAGQGHPQLRF